jgi:hypothetical protein
MLYATINKDRWDSIPAEWDEVQDMFKYLNRMTYGTQLTFESRMFNTGEGYPYRAVLIRWNNITHPDTNTNKREVLLETSDPEQMEAALLMLISEAETEQRAGKQISMIP